MVKNNEVEQDLKKIVRDSEAERRKKEQEVQRLQEELNRKKRDYAAKIREQIAQAEREERELEELMLKEKSKLDQVSISFQIIRVFYCQSQIEFSLVQVAYKT